MYRGVVRVLDNPLPTAPADEPASPVEKELVRTISFLRESTDKSSHTLGTYPKNVAVQTDVSESSIAPPGYAVPKVFVRSVAEAIEQGVIAYCSLIRTRKERDQAVKRLLYEVAEYVNAPRHLFVETFETRPSWYDYAKISVFDCVTSDNMGSADIMPPSSRTVISNVNIPLYESAIVQDDSVPHLPQVEISLLKFNPNSDEKNQVVAQSVSVPLELFVKCGTIVVLRDNGEEREISYRAALIRDENPNEPN